MVVNMSILQFPVPPFPTFIKMGEAFFTKGKKHFKRTFVVFDLIYVSKGCLYMSEDQEEFEIREGNYIVLVPGLEHYGYKGCECDTAWYWLHFKIEGAYSITDKKEISWSDIKVHEGDFVEPNQYFFRIPRFGEIHQKSYFEGLFEKMIHANDSDSPELPLRQQIWFEELLLHIQKEAMQIPSATERITDRTIQYIKKYYQTDMKMEDLANELHFHTDYITRCMQKTVGMSPIQYLNQYRITQSKRLLSKTNEKVMTISKSVGIDDHTYFSKLFKKMEGISPSEYRQLSQRESNV